MSNSAGEAALLFGTTNDTWGYINSLSSREVWEKITAADGAGDAKRVEYFNQTFEVTINYTFRADLNAPHSDVGSGTVVNIADGKGILPNSGNIYIEEAEKNAEGGDSPGFKSVDAVGTWYPNLG